MRSNSQSGDVTDEIAIEQLITKVCQKFIVKLDEKLGERFDKLESQMNDISNKMAEINKSVNINKKDICTLYAKQEENEIFHKRNMLRFDGLHEKENENLLQIITNLVNQSMKVKCTIADISNIYRIGKVNSDKIHTRTIIVEFISFLKRNEILKAKGTLKQSGIFVNENLTIKQYDLLKKAKHKYGRKEVWSWAGTIFAKVNDEVKKIQNEADI